MPSRGSAVTIAIRVATTGKNSRAIIVPWKEMIDCVLAKDTFNLTSNDKFEALRSSVSFYNIYLAI